MALGYGSRSGDGYWPQLHEDTLALMPQEQCGVLQMAYGAGSSPVQACTGEASLQSALILVCDRESGAE